LGHFLVFDHPPRPHVPFHTNSLSISVFRNGEGWGGARSSVLDPPSSVFRRPFCFMLFTFCFLFSFQSEQIDPHCSSAAIPCLHRKG
jgi:hypothetical protein